MNTWSRGREVEKIKPPKQLSVSQLPEHEQDAAMTGCELASERYPSVLVEGHLVHVYEQAGEWHVWLNCEDAELSEGLAQDVSPAPLTEKAYMINVAPYQHGVGGGKWQSVDGWSERILDYIVALEAEPWN